MRSKLFLVLFGCLMLSSQIFAAQHYVTTLDELNTALTNYAAGDEIIVASGTYGINGTKTITKSLTIKADPLATTKPVLSQVMFSMNTSDVSLTLEGLEMYWDLVDAVTPTSSRYFLSLTSAVCTFPSITFRNCEIHGYGRSLIRADNSTNVATISNLTVDNCLIHDMGRESNGYSIFAVKTAKITTALFKNTTIYNAKNGFWYSEVTTAPIALTLENSSILKTTAAGSKLNINTNANPGSVYTIKNSIISDSYDATSANMVLKLNSNGTTVLAHVDNSILGNHFPATKITGSLTTNTEVAVSALSFDFASKTIQTTPNTLSGLGDPRWSLNPVIASPKTLTVQVSPEGAGVVTVTPTKSQYADGELVKLSQVRNFGYAFKHWQNASGAVLSTATDFEFNITKDTVVTAVYESVQTYALAITKLGSQWGEIALNPAPVNGMYETGTVVTLTIVPNAVSTFIKWDDETTTTTRQLTMDAAKSVSASFDQIPFIVGWNFKVAEPRTNRSGDFYSSTGNMGMIAMYEPAGANVNWLANAGSFTPSYPCVRIWTAGASFQSTRRYFQAQFSTVGWTNVQVKSMMSGNYQCFSVQKLQYSLDGTNFTDLGSVDITSVYNSGWKDLNATLPAAAEGQEKVYIRWIADATSTVLGNSGDNDGTALTNVYVYADEVTVNDTEAPTLVSTVPAQNTTNASAQGTITLSFNERVKAGTGDITLGSKVLTPVFGSTSVSIAYTKLEYNTDYTLTVPAGALTDMSGNAFAGLVLNFRTMNRPQPAAKVFNFVVAADGSGNGTTLQSAFDAVPVNNATPFLIFIKNGVYNEYPTLPATKPFVHIIGQSRDGVIISGNRYSGLVSGGVTYSTSTCQTLELMAGNVYCENFTVRNTAGVSAGQAVALKAYGDKVTFNNIKLLGYQDTHLTGTGRQLYKNSAIHGTVDFIFGGGDVFFDDCLLYCEGRSNGDVITAPSTGASLQWGYVFNNCTIDGDAATQNNQYLLGRPWQNGPRSVYINTTMNILPAAGGWTNMAVAPALFAEYNSRTATGDPVDLSNRKSSFTTDATNGNITTTGHQTVLSAAEAATYTLENVLKGTDNWDPLPLLEKTDAPANVTVGATGVINWEVVPYAISYVVMKNNVVVGFTTTATYTDAAYSADAEYSVVAVAESGTLSAATKAVSDIGTSTHSTRWDAKATIANNLLTIQQVQPGTLVSVYSFNGMMIAQTRALTETVSLPVQGSCIVRLTSAGKTSILKVLK